MSNVYITEAFKRFYELDESLNEDVTEFSLTSSGPEDTKSFLDIIDDADDAEDLVTNVYDLEAEAEEDLKQSYIGKIIADCNICHTEVFLDKDQVVVDEDGVCCSDVECPYCMSTDGYTIIGEVKPFKSGDVEEVETETELEEPEEVEETEVEDDIELPEDEDGEEEIEEQYLKSSDKLTASKKLKESFSYDDAHEIVMDTINSLPGCLDDADPAKSIYEYIENTNPEWIESMENVLECDLYDYICDMLETQDYLEEGLAGTVAGGVAGAIVGKSPAAIETGATIGSALQDKFSESCETEEIEEACCKEECEDTLEEGVVDSLKKAGRVGASAALNSLADDVAPEELNESAAFSDDYLRQLAKQYPIEGHYAYEIKSVNGEPVISVQKASEHNRYYDTWTGYVCFETKNNTYYYPVLVTDVSEDILLDDEDAWDFVGPLPTLSTSKKSKDEELNEARGGDARDGYLQNKNFDFEIVSNKDGHICNVHSESEAKQTIAQLKREDKKAKITGVEYSVNKKEINESIEDVSVSTEDETMTMTTKEDGGVVIETLPKEKVIDELPIEGEEEIIAPIEPETESEIEAAIENNDESEEEPIDELGEEEFDMADDIDDFDEESFDELGESYLKKCYENVTGFKTSKVSVKNDSFLVEGKISFDSGNVKNTQFVFTPTQRKNDKIKLEGFNSQISRGKKSFKLNCSIKNKALTCESLNYNYRSKNELNESVRVYGTVKKG